MSINISAEVLRIRSCFIQLNMFSTNTMAKSYGVQFLVKFISSQLQQNSDIGNEQNKELTLFPEGV